MNEPRPSPQTRGLDLDGFRAAMREHRNMFLAFFAAVVLATVIGTALAARKYQAIALIQLMPRAGREVEVDEVVRDDAGGYLEAQERARTQIQIILSRSVLEKVLLDYAALGYTDFPPGPDSTTALSRTMTVQPRENTQLVEIAVEHEDPECAAILANIIADVYSSFNLDARTDAARGSKGWIDTRIETARANLDAASAEAMTFRQEHDLVDIDDNVNGVTTRMTSLQAALGEATAQRVLLQGKLDSHLRLLRRGEYQVLAGMFPGDPALDTMSRERASIVMETSEVLARYGEQHPEHQRAVERMARVDALLEEAVRRNVEEERSQVGTLTAQEQQIGDELQKVKSELLERQRYQKMYAELALDEDRARELYESLKERGTEVELQARSELNDVRIVDRAVPPTRPSSPNLPLNLAVSLIVGLFGGVGLVLARKRLARADVAATEDAKDLGPPVRGPTDPGLSETGVPVQFPEWNDR